MSKKKIAIALASLMLVAGSAFAQEGRGGGFGGGRGGGFGGGRGAGVLNIVDTVTTATGLTLEQLREALQSGKTLGEIITENGGTIEDVTAQITQAVTDQVNQAVTDGKMTQERADEVLANLATRIDEAMNSTAPLGDGMGNLGGRGAGMLNLADTVTTATGLTLEQLREAFQSGKTLGEVITENGGTIEDVTAQITQAVTDQVNQAVTDGKITQARADEILANLATRIDEAMNSTAPLGDGLGNLGGRGAGMLNLADTVTAATGLTLEQLREALQSGKTLGEVITENGGTIEDVTAQITQAVTDQVNQAVTDGKITQARADEILANLATRIDEAMNSTVPLRDGKGNSDGSILPLTGNNA